MKITKVSSRIVAVPDDDTLAPEATRQPKVRPVVTLRVATDQGIDGLGIAFTLGGLNAAVLAVLEELAGLLVGEDPTRIEAILQKLRKAASTGGNAGLFLLAQAAVDMALWDIRGKMAGLPLWRLAGGARDNAVAYASGLIGRDLTDQQAVSAAEHVVAQGFGWVKMHLGLPGNGLPQREVQRAKLVRQAVGPDIRLGADVNERWRVDEAIAIGRMLEEVGFAWLEDPVRHDDYRGMTRVTAALCAPVMAGENNWGIYPFRIMLQEQSVDIVMIDVMLAGGITAWLKIAAMAETFNIPVVSHLLPEIQAHLVAGVQNGLLAEYKSWIWQLFDEVPAFRNGVFSLSDQPGLGLRFSRRFLDDGW
jgi:L-alanine-DL-glutamate epimerase-like enolase superfamily enzyme